MIESPLGEVGPELPLAFISLGLLQYTAREHTEILAMVKLSHVKAFKGIICAFQIWYFQLKLELWGSGISPLYSL